MLIFADSVSLLDQSSGNSVGGGVMGSLLAANGLSGGGGNDPNGQTPPSLLPSLIAASQTRHLHNPAAAAAAPFADLTLALQLSGKCFTKTYSFP